ncbi:MAG: hypothetical protein KDC80_22755 [Saprospiraceae bacterium]|nr:hypothetical protein [Saprospiraceae bacterium]
MGRAAVLDLGSNTFHILIIEKSEDGYVELVRKREYVKLAIDGIENLSEAAMKRGLDALIQFKNLIDKYKVETVQVIGTAALRTAKNGPEYLKRIFAATGFEVELIDGIEEARYIYLGVSQVWQDPDLPVLIMDIGGGSVEYIIADNEHFYWSSSFPVGVAVLYREFHHTEPISGSEKKQLACFLKSHLSELVEAINLYQPKLLIGASGTFDVIGSIVGGHSPIKYREIDRNTVIPMINAIVAMNEQERNADPQIPDSRVDLIVVALLLLRYTLEMGDFEKIGISTYALKEGVVATLV